MEQNPGVPHGLGAVGFRSPLVFDHKMVVPIFLFCRQVTIHLTGNFQNALFNAEDFARIFIVRVFQPAIETRQILPIEEAKKPCA